MAKPRVGDGERGPSSTRTYESNAKLLGLFLWTTVVLFSVTFVLIGEQLRLPPAAQIVSMLTSVGGVVAVVVITWPLMYQLLSSRRAGEHSLDDIL